MNAKQLTQQIQDALAEMNIQQLQDINKRCMTICSKNSNRKTQHLSNLIDPAMIGEELASKMQGKYQKSVWLARKYNRYSTQFKIEKVSPVAKQVDYYIPDISNFNDIMLDVLGFSYYNRTQRTKTTFVFPKAQMDTYSKRILADRMKTTKYNPDVILDDLELFYEWTYDTGLTTITKLWDTDKNAVYYDVEGINKLGHDTGVIIGECERYALDLYTGEVTPLANGMFYAGEIVDQLFAEYKMSIDEMPEDDPLARRVKILLADMWLVLKTNVQHRYNDIF